MILSCETAPDIYIPSRPVPVIHAVFHDHDSIHRILVTKTFGAEKSPADFGFVHDSLYWKEIDVTVRLKEHYSDEWIEIKPERIRSSYKDSGFFRHPDQEYFEFIKVILDTPAHPLYRKVYGIDTIDLCVTIPGYPQASCTLKRIDSVKIVSPLFDQKYLYLVPHQSLLFIWHGNGHAWSEIDVTFEFIEELTSGRRSKWVHIQNTLYNESAFEKYRQMNITYEEFIREVLLQIEDDPQVIRRYIGFVSMEIVGGDQPMVDYMKFLDGYTDYHFQGYTNITNGLGVMATSTQFKKDSMRFDYETRQTLINENRLRPLKISPWSE